MSEVRLRRACSADIPAMSAIRLSVRENVLSDPGRVTLQMYEDYLERDGRGWVAEVDGVVAAFSYADREKASIWALFVSPQHEGRGLGKAVLALAVAWLFEIGQKSIRLSTTSGTGQTGSFQYKAGEGCPASAQKSCTCSSRSVTCLRHPQHFNFVRREIDDGSAIRF